MLSNISLVNTILIMIDEKDYLRNEWALEINFEINCHCIVLSNNGNDNLY